MSRYLITGTVESRWNPSAINDPQFDMEASFPFSETIEADSPQSAIASACRSVVGNKGVRHHSETFTLETTEAKPV